MITIDGSIDAGAIRAAFDAAQAGCQEGDTLRGRVSGALRAQLFQHFIGIDALAGGIRLQSTDTSGYEQKFEIFGYSMVVDFTMSACCLIVERMQSHEAAEVRSSCVPTSYMEAQRGC